MRLSLFYDEPEADRWVVFDRFPRRILRRILRPKPPIGGHKRVFLNLCTGLDQIGVSYRINDFRFARRNPNELVCIVGKPCVLEKTAFKNPTVFGAAVYSHPIERPNLLTEFPNVRRILVPGDWMRQMFEPYWGGKVVSWPVGIDTDEWRPIETDKKYDVLLYDKVRWEHDRFDRELITPIRDCLKEHKLSVCEMRYGSYEEQDFRAALQNCRAMIFLCEHETQGIAYQQALSSGVPILAWDRRGFWQDPAFYPHKVPIFSCDERAVLGRSVRPEVQG